MLEKHSIEDNQYYTGIEIEENPRIKSYKLLFYNNEGNLLAYIKINYSEIKKIATIIDITNGNGYKHFTDYRKDFYLSHGYKEGVFRKGFGLLAFEEAIRFIKKEFPNVHIVPVCSLERNKNYVLSLIDKTKEKTGELIKSVTGGGDSTIATLRI